MSASRALVECVVLSVQDTSVFYPSCRGCFSRIEVEQRDTARCRCSRCGYLCLKEEVNYRYRLSLRVSRNKHIFGVTVFGSNLNKFFGIDATGLQRLVKNTDDPVEPSGKFTLLLKAIEDCFIGRRFIFCMKYTENDSRPWVDVPVPNSSKDTTQFIATQMILPKAPGLQGCTVVTYYQKLQQKASDNHCRHSDSSGASRFPTTQLLLTPHHSPVSSFNATLPSPRVLFPSTLMSKHLDGVLSPTPPWRQSLGLVTSSAEQEESGSGDETSRQTDNSAMMHWVGRGCLPKHETPEKTTVFYLKQSLSSPSNVKYPNPPFRNSVRTSSAPNTSFTLSQPDHNSHNDRMECCTKEWTRTLLSSSVDWEDLPLSESLTEFICGENKDIDVVIDTEPNRNVLHQINMAGNHVETANQTTETICAGQANALQTESQGPHVLLDVSNVPNMHNTPRLSDQVCKDFLQHENQSQATNTQFPRVDEQNHLKLLFENEEQDFIEDDYNCSADLFSNSSLVDTNTEMVSCKAETAGTTKEVCPLSLKLDPKSLRPSPKENLSLNRCRSYNRDSLTIQDFVPPSQSTPNVKAFVSHSFTSPHRKLTHEFICQLDRQDPEAVFENMYASNSKKPVNATSVLQQLNTLVSAGQRLWCGKVCVKESLTWSTTPSRCGCKRATERRLRTSDENKNPRPAHRHFQMQRRSGNLLSGASSHRRDSRVSTESVCGNDSSDILVPPTPAGKIQQSVIQQQTRQSGSCSSRLTSSIVEQQRVANDCQITVNSSHRAQGQTKCVADDGNLNLSNDYLAVDESWTSDWSRDLFSDSVRESD